MGIKFGDTMAGLSPRVRGNRVMRQSHAIIGWSIPASAGEPAVQSSGRYQLEVYPRECGGTDGPCWWEYCSHGLSPRVRGNQRTILLSQWGLRSIPASAGLSGQ